MDNRAINDTAALTLLDEVFGDTSVVYYTAAAGGDFAPNYVSRNIVRVLGVRPESCIGSSSFWREHVHVEDVGRVLHEFSVIAATGRCTQKFRFRRDQNNYRRVVNEVSIKRDTNGIPTHMAGCLIDADEICSEECAREEGIYSAKEYFYRSVLDSIPLRLFWKDRNSVFRGCNLSGARTLDLSQTDEIVGKTDYDLYPDRGVAAYLHDMDERVMNSGQPSYHSEVSASDGGTWMDVTKVPLCDENGEVYGLLISYEDVSALKKSERALHKFKRAVEQSSSSIFITDVTGNIEYVNPVFLGTYGYAEHEVLGKNPRLLKSDFVRREVFRDLWQTILSGQSWRGELLNRSRNGSVSWQRTSISPIFDEGGKISHFLAIEDDVTARKSIEKALAENEARLREITATVGEGIYVTDPAGTITFVNPAATKLLGRSAKSLLGNNARNIFNCPKRDELHGGGAGSGKTASRANRWLDKIQRKAIHSESQFFRRKNGSIFQVSIMATPIFRDNQFAGAVVAFHDITEQKSNQRLLGDTLQELSTVLDNAQIGVAYLRESKFSWVNKHMEQMFGYACGGLHGQPMDAIYISDTNGANGLKDEIYSLLGEGKIYENEPMMKRRSGEIFWCHQRGVAIDKDDPAKGSIWIMLDIDRLKNTEDRLRALNETLAQRVEEETQNTLDKERLLIQQGRSAAMGEMIGNIAHQWRQPLSTLGLVVQNIRADYLEKTLDEQVLEKYVDTAKHAIQKMSCTIDDFRNFFRPNRVKVYFSIHQSIHEAVQLLDAMLKSNGIAVLLTGERELKATGHPNELSQVVLNFLANSKDALVARKVPQGYIAVELAERDGYGVISIKDNAGGIPEDKLGRIFEPYFTTKPSGTGIGLYMNKTIIEKHMGGSINFRNGPEGAEFTIAIPLRPD